MLVAMAHVTFIHGIANKPEEGALLKLWRRSLAQGEGVDLSTERVSSSMVHWADLMYAEPLAEEATQESLESVDAPGADPVDMSWQVREGGAEQAWAAQLEAKLEASLTAVEVETAVAPSPPQAAEPALPRGGLTQEAFERIPLPWFVKERLMDILLRDVHHYLFDVEFSSRPGPGCRIQEEIRRRFLKRLREGAEKPGPHVVVSHSMGTVIAYDCLKRVPDCPPVDALVTIGSPLGLDEIQDKCGRSTGDRVGAATTASPPSACAALGSTSTTASTPSPGSTRSSPTIIGAAARRWCATSTSRTAASGVTTSASTSAARGCASGLRELLGLRAVDE